MNRLIALAGPAILAVGLIASPVAFAAPRSALPVVAGERVTTPGVYDISVVYIPGISVPGGLPECVEKFAEQTYLGQLTVTKTATGSHMSFVGTNADDPRLNIRASADVNENWGGFLLGPLGGREDALVGIDVANVVSGSITGFVSGENGKKGRLMVKVGAAGEIIDCKFVGGGAH